MGIFSTCESLSEGFFKVFFRKRLGRLQPVEIAKQLVREMSLKKTISATTVYAPNFFVVRLNSKDWALFSGFVGSFIKELEGYLEEEAEERGYTLVGPVKVYIEDEEKLGKGEMIIHTHLEEQEVPENLPGEEWIFLCTSGPDEGSTFKLKGENAIIGRDGRNLIHLSDPSVARKHAQLTCTDHQYFITDLGNISGTFVNNERIEKIALKNGDKIMVGSSELEVRVK